MVGGLGAVRKAAPVGASEAAVVHAGRLKEQVVGRQALATTVAVMMEAELQAEAVQEVGALGVGAKVEEAVVGAGMAGETWAVGAMEVPKVAEAELSG